MTARQPPRPNGLNAKSNGRGLKVVTKPITKKRGASADRTKPIAENRKKYVSATNIPTHLVAEMIDPDKPLTDKAKLFVKFWAQGESITSASARAGYGDGANYAYRLVHFPQAKALYLQEKALFEEANQMSRKKVMDGLLDGIEMAKLTSDAPAVITGWKTIGQMCGYFEPVKRVIDVNLTGNVTMKQLNGLSTEELVRLVAESATQELAQLTHTPGDDDAEDQAG